MSDKHEHPIPFPYSVIKDEHAIWHIRKLKGGECVACIDAATFEILRAYFSLLAGCIARHRCGGAA